MIIKLTYLLFFTFVLQSNIMKIGIDIVDIEELGKKVADNPKIIEKMLSSQETKEWRMEALAGKIAAKEAIQKTGYIKAGEWLEIQILNKDSGEPYVVDKTGGKLDNLQVSISHKKDLAVAVALLL